MLSVLVPFQPPHNHHPNPIRIEIQLDEFRLEIQRRDQEILAMAAKMKTLEEQHQDYQRHIAVLKESLCAKEEHYNMLQTDVEEMRARLEEKNRLIEKKTQGTLQTVQERNRLTSELTELKDHMDIKDRKISVLQRRVRHPIPPSFPPSATI
ncbi:GM16903 [Drosophila sechellia]|uniref:GM16903 n=1 Tax=Drosophila sechellia TaxID=7238 RepID=B4IQH1_DROSE|nr:GM16903 [Drosophila sechellia]